MNPHGVDLGGVKDGVKYPDSIFEFCSTEGMASSLATAMDQGEDTSLSGKASPFSDGHVSPTVPADLQGNSFQQQSHQQQQLLQQHSQQQQQTQQQQKQQQQMIQNVFQRPLPMGPMNPLMRGSSHETLMTGKRPGMGGLQQVEVPRHEKPPYSFPCLIGLALMSKPGGQMCVSEIYQYICANFPYFITAKAGWKNSIRHNLSLNKFFAKVERQSDDQGKGSLWAIAPNMTENLKRDIKNCEAKNPEKLEQSRASYQLKKQAAVAPQNRGRSLSYTGGFTGLPQEAAHRHDPRLSDSVTLPRDLMSLSPDVFMGGLGHTGQPLPEFPSFADYLSTDISATDPNAVFSDSPDLCMPWMSSPVPSMVQ